MCRIHQGVPTRGASPKIHQKKLIHKVIHSMVSSTLRMKCIYTRPLNDQELRSHLERGDTVTFSEAVKDWAQIERQVERLGFGGDYAVSRGSRPDPAGRQRHTRVAPLRGN